jgi:DNA polymerase-3 subunit alpha
LAGYDWAEVDKFRKAVGKKIPEEMAKQHVRFVKGCMEYSRMTKDEAEAVWNLFEPFQGYGFNKAHSASYGIIAYYTAYMKANYPVEYMTAMMTADAGDTDKVAVEVNAAREMGIEVLGPDINESDVHFTVVKKEGSLNGQAIRFGLSAIKNVGEAAVEEIVRVRNRESGIGNQELNSSTGQNSSDTNGQISVVKPFSSLTDFFYRVDGRKVNKKVLESLIKAGTFDKFGNRAALLAGIDNLRILAEQMKKRKASGQVELFSSFVEAMDNAGEQKEALRDIFPEVREFTQEQKLEFEKELLGFYLTDNPLEGRLASMELAVTHKIKQLNPDLHVGQVVKIGGVVVDCRVVTTKKSNQQMAFAVLEDQTGKIDLVIFPKTYMESKKYWNEDALTLVEGRVEYREEALSLIVNRVIEVGADQKNDDNADRNSDVFANRDENILVIPKGLDRNKLVALNSLLLSRSGDDRLTLIFENGRNGGRRVRVPFGVDYSKKVQKEVVELLKQE